MNKQANNSVEFNNNQIKKTQRKRESEKKILGILNQQIARIKIENVKSTENINILT